MRFSLRLVPTMTLGAALALSTACGKDEETPTPDAGTPPADAGTPATDAGTETTLYQRLGGNAGIAGAVDAIVAAELMDPEIAAYFTFATEFPGAINATQIKECLVAQLGSVSGGPEQYPTTVSGGHVCRDMTEAHKNLGITEAHFDKFVTIAAGVLTTAGVAEADIAVIGGVLNGTKGVIATGPTLYQRLGRAQGIAGAVTAIVDAELMDAEIAAYFTAAAGNPGAPSRAQIEQCLVAQLGSVSGGPQVYPTTVGGGHTCRDMKSAHEGLGITSASFDKFVTIAAGVLTGAGVPADDIGIIGGVLNSTKGDIVEE